MNGTEKQMRRRAPLVWEHMKVGAWEVIGRTGNGHVQLRHLESRRKIAVSLSPSCARTDLNTRARMRKVELQHAELSTV